MIVDLIDLGRGIARRDIGDPEVHTVIDLDDDSSVEFRAYGHCEYRWAYCRHHQAVRWLYPGTLEQDLVRALVNKTKVTLTSK